VRVLYSFESRREREQQSASGQIDGLDAQDKRDVALYKRP